MTYGDQEVLELDSKVFGTVVFDAAEEERKDLYLMPVRGFVISNTGVTRSAQGWRVAAAI
jgi:hypothetical protein